MEPAQFRPRSSLEKGRTPRTDSKWYPGEIVTPHAQSSSIACDDDARLLARIGYKQV